MLYVRFPLSLRNVEDLLHERGIEVSHETVRYWWNRFGPMFAAEIRRRRIQSLRSSRWQWHLDEVFVKINGKTALPLARRRPRGRGAGGGRHQDPRSRGSPAFPQETAAPTRPARSPGHRPAPYLRRSPSETRPAGQAAVEMAAGSTTGQRTRTCRSEGARGRCCGSGGCEVSRSSPPSTPQSTTIHFNLGRSLSSRSIFRTNRHRRP